jgi:excinuclease ABC subunit B
MDNRPLKFEEFETMQNQAIYVSNSSRLCNCKTEGVVVEQVIRPGIITAIEIRPSLNQIDDLIEEIGSCKILNVFWLPL